MKTREEALTYGLSFPNTYQDTPFRDTNWQLVRVKESRKAFLWIYEKDGYINLNVKADPEWRDFWRNTYPSVIAGYHQNKEHWNTIILDGTIPDEDVRRMIAESYDQITDSPSRRIYEAVKRIPKGKVATYGQVAEMAGNRKMARAVGNALHKNPDPDSIPCYRVVNAKGEMAGEFAFGGAGAQARLLEEDGIEVVNGMVDLKKYGIYKLAETSQNTDQIRKDKARKDAVSALKENCTEENLWNCIVAFQEYPFYTSSGLPFHYTLKVGRNGTYTKELFINRRENSKSLSWSSVKIAFQKVMDKKNTVFVRPKEIADLRGISYSYSLLWRFGVITVPEKVEKMMKGEGNLAF